VSDDVGGRLDGIVGERYGDSVDDLGGRIDEADAGHAELHPVVAGGLNVDVGQHRQQNVVDAIDLGVDEIDKQSSTDEARVQTHLPTEQDAQLSRRGRAICFVSLKILLSHSRSCKVIRYYTDE